MSNTKLLERLEELIYSIEEKADDFCREKYEYSPIPDFKIKIKNDTVIITAITYEDYYEENIIFEKKISRNVELEATIKVSEYIDKLIEEDEYISKQNEILEALGYSMFDDVTLEDIFD